MEGPRIRWKEQVGGRIVGNGPADDLIRESGKKEAAAEAVRFQREHPELVEKIEQLLAEIDFDELQNIFTQYTTRSGIEKGVVSIPTREDVLILGNSKSRVFMEYASYLHAIRIYALAVEDAAKSREMSETELKTSFLKFAPQQKVIHRFYR